MRVMKEYRLCASCWCGTISADWLAQGLLSLLVTQLRRDPLGGTWPVCVGDSEHPDPIGLAMIEVINEPDASLYNMLVGFYRQAIDSLRIILDSVSIGAYCQLTAQGNILQNWLDGNVEVKFNEVA